jgi:hypothetical protein
LVPIYVTRVAVIANSPSPVDWRSTMLTIYCGFLLSRESMIVKCSRAGFGAKFGVRSLFTAGLAVH